MIQQITVVSLIFTISSPRIEHFLLDIDNCLVYIYNREATSC